MRVLYASSTINCFLNCGNTPSISLAFLFLLYIPLIQWPTLRFRLWHAKWNCCSSKSLPFLPISSLQTPSTASCTTPACQTTCVTLLIFYALSFLAIAQRVYTDLITAVQSPGDDAPSLPTAHDPMPSNSMSQSSRIRFVEPPDAPPVLSGHTQPSKTPHGDVSIHPVISGSGFTLTLVVSYHIPLASE